MPNRSSIVKRNLYNSPYPVKHVVDFPRYRKPLHPKCGVSMTTCVAAITYEKREPPFPSLIVSASDLRISFITHSADNTVKSEPFHESWTAMIAGEEISQAVPVIERATKLLEGDPGSFTKVRKEFKRAYQEQRQEVIEDRLLSPFDMNLQEFKKEGRSQLPPKEYASIVEEIRRINLGCMFLVYGFDEKKRPHIFVVDNPGQVSVWDKPGFCAIGSGSETAMAMLSHLRQAKEESSFEETVYNVLAQSIFPRVPKG